ncbi:hypothetical protein EOD42_15225 [Rhodovarius crocodyli]|uniref:Uncharacterized protein n=1 Tax=Rhodovarius crocodyli TaxID=1979269 RepID=A0A437MD34_9PROT|nr:hypothetical protein [Rhodovarius crocodyli]RVT95559.1 hypothetical protein EOD42_15225 [Rhodovarius crocodyli]
MPTPLTFLDFARVSAAVYDPSISSVGGFTRSNDTRRWSGFQGAIYTRANGGGFDVLVAYAGTQPTDGMGRDIVTDVGFGGNTATALSPVLGIMGWALLNHQIGCAVELLLLAQRNAPRSGRIFVCGHSLGGGLAAIVAAQTGTPAVPISSPAVTGVDGVYADYLRTRRPKITCLRIKNDPINHTGIVGDWLGRIVLLNSPRTGGDAHSIDMTQAELEPSGSFSGLGARDPFAT